MDPVLERLNGQLMVVCAIPEEDQIKINGDMYGPIKTPHPIYINDVKLMLFYGKEVKAVDPDATPEEIEAAELLTLEVLEAAEELFLLEEEAAKEEDAEEEEVVEEEEPKEPSVAPEKEPVTKPETPAAEIADPDETV